MVVEVIVLEMGDGKKDAVLAGEPTADDESGVLHVGNVVHEELGIDSIVRRVGDMQVMGIAVS